jgi:quinol-cytochrome oxidoreductase complex cytochrome b subunit
MEEQKPGVLRWLARRLTVTEIFSLFTSFGLFYAELDNRKPLRQALAEALERPTVSYARWPHVLGIIIVVLLGVEILTGTLLALYYLPTPDAAHASVRTILRDVSFGWFVHHVHFWGAQILIAALIVRLVRFFYHRVYQAPRELIWVFSALLLLVCLHADLTGWFLPWTEDSYWSSARTLDIVDAVPVYGAFVSFLIGGGEGPISELTLIRFYILHIAILPLFALTLVYLHFSSVRRIGLTESPRENTEIGANVLRIHVANLAIVLTLLVGLLVTLAVLLPVPFLAKADPYTTVPGIAPPWYLLAPFALLELTAGILPQWLMGSILFIAFLVFTLLPFVDRSASGRRGLLLSRILAGLVLIAWVALTIYGTRVA